MAKITVEYIEKVRRLYAIGDINFGRMFELLNEKAAEPEEIFIVRWFHNDNDDVVCANKEIAEKYIEDYNSRSGFKTCYVETCYPLDAPTQ